MIENIIRIALGLFIGFGLITDVHKFLDRHTVDRPAWLDLLVDFLCLALAVTMALTISIGLRQH